MATYNTAFGSLPGYKEMMGTTNTTAGGEEKQPTVYGGQTQTQRTTQQPAQTFAQMQQRGVARPPAPTGPTASPFAQYGGSQQGQQLRSQLQQRLTEFGQAPSRYDTEAFKQIRGAQAANLQSEYGAQQKALNEDLARRGLSASSIGGGRMGDLAGQQARALSSLDAQLLQQAAETQAQDRAQLMQSGQGLAELAGAQDLAQFEANRVAQAATFENQLRAAQFGQQQFEQAGQEAFQGAQAEESASQAARQFDLSALGQTAGLSLDLQRLLGTQEVERAGLTGQLDKEKTLAAVQQETQKRQASFQQAAQMSEQSGFQYTVDANGNVVPLQSNGQLVRTSSFTQAEEARRQQKSISELDIGLRRQLGLMEATGQGLTVDAEGNVIPATGAAAQTLQARQIATQEKQLAFQNASRLSEQSGMQYTVNEQNQVVPLRDAQGNTVRTSAETQAVEARRQQAEQFTVSQFGVSAPTAETQTLSALQQQLQQAGITGTFQGKLTQDALQNAYARAAQLSQATGQQYTVDQNTGGIVAGVGDTLEARLRQAGITGTFGGGLTQEALQTAYQRSAQLSQITGKQYTVNPTNGQIVEGTAETLAAQLQKGELTGTLGGVSTTQAKQLAFQNAARLSEQSGVQYTVNAQGQPEVLRDAAGQPIKTSADTRAAEALKQEKALFDASLQQRLQEFMTQQTGNLYGLGADGKAVATAGTTIGGQTASYERALEQAKLMSAQTGQTYNVSRDANGMYSTIPVGGQTQSALELQLRKALGMSEVSGYVYDPVTGQRTASQTVESQQANNQLFMSLAQILSGLNTGQFSQLTGGTYTPPAQPTEGTVSGAWIFRNNAWVPNTQA